MNRYLIVTIAFLVGCANPINQRTAENYYEGGERALQRGDLPHAREMFSRALINARVGNLDDAAEAQVLSKLGRVYGNLCQYDEAEKAFLEARDRYVRMNQATPGKAFPIRVELAQFSYDVGRYEKADVYFREAFAVLDPRFKEVDPEGYSAWLKDYADASSKLGKAEQARALLAEVAELEGKASTARIGKGSAYVRYPTSCK